MLWIEPPVQRVGQRFDGKLNTNRSLHDGMWIEDVWEALCLILNWDVRLCTCYNMRLLLFSYLTFSSLFSTNCSCFCLTSRLSFSTEGRCYLKKKRNYWGALGLRQRWNTLLAHLHSNMWNPTSSLCTLSCGESHWKYTSIYIHET